MAENRRPLYAIIEKIDIESWETGIYQLRMDRVCILNLLYFGKNHQTCPIWKKSCSTCLLKKFIFPNKHRFRILPDNPSLSNLDYYTYSVFFHIFRSPRIPTVRRIPVQKAPSMDDRSITELSIHDMQMVMMHPDASTSSFLSRSLSESDLSEISPIGGASGSGTQSPVQMMAPSDDDNDSTGKLWKNCTAAANRLLYVARIWVVL